MLVSFFRVPSKKNAHELALNPNSRLTCDRNNGEFFQPEMAVLMEQLFVGCSSSLGR